MCGGGGLGHVVLRGRGERGLVLRKPDPGRVEAPRGQPLRAERPAGAPRRLRPGRPVRLGAEALLSAHRGPEELLHLDRWISAHVESRDLR